MEPSPSFSTQNWIWIPSFSLLKEGLALLWSGCVENCLLESLGQVDILLIKSAPVLGVFSIW